jgi:hypothetical protein
MSELIIPRRQLLIGAAASLIGGPSIVRASSLMQIDRLGNRLIVAWRYKYYPTDTPNPSVLNLTNFTSDDFRVWAKYNDGNEYSLERRDNVNMRDYDWLKKECSRESLEGELRRARMIYT